MPTSERLVTELRKRLGDVAEGFSDDEVLEKTRGSFLRAGVDIDMALRDLGAAAGVEAERIKRLLRISH